MMRCGLLLAAACAASGLSLTPATDNVVQDEYIVLLHGNVTVSTHEALRQRLSGRKFAIGKTFRAVHAKLSSDELQWVLRQEDLVRSVEHNQEVRLAQDPGSCPAAQPDPVSWGQVRTTSSGPTAYDSFRHNPTWGEGADIYVVDTGIRCTHVDFKNPQGENRCEWGVNTAGGSDTDVNGHGTHCASTSGGLTWGIAKAAKLIAVKVLGDNGSGTTAGVIAGVEWVATSANSKTGRRSVANMSLGGGFSAALNEAVNAAVGEGVLMAVSAGNDNHEARLNSPASAEAPITVGSTELASSGGQLVDARSSFSNYGSAVDVFAPGSSIVAAYASSDTATATLSGTSMASPHVAGVLAVGLSMADVVGKATPDLIASLPAGSPNKMLYLQCSS